MSFEREQAHERASYHTTNHDADVAPGRRAVSSQLFASSHPIASVLIQRKVNNDGDPAVDADEHVSRAAFSSGSPLPDELRSQFEHSLDADLSGIRIHTGTDSDAAASSVNARAFAIGHDIHFAAGEYAPHSETGRHLLAHEVAHTVQQSGGPVVRQNKLIVSSLGDSLEIEADRAADAMVTGAPASVTTNGGTMISMKGDDKKEEDKKWAEATRGKVRAVQDAVIVAIDRLNDEASKAITNLRRAETAYKNYETKYNAALDRFKSEITAAQKASQELRDNLSFVASTILTAQAPVFMKAMGDVTGALEKAEKIANLASSAGVLPSSKEKSESNKDIGPSAKVDWKELVSKAIATIEGFVKQNKALAETSKQCVTNDRFIATVLEGKAADDARNSAEAQACEKMASNSTPIISDLTGIGTGLATSATAFANSASAALDGADPRKIEQDIAIKWISTLKISVKGMQVDDQTEEIDEARSYLKALGIESRLGHDAGMWMFDADQHILWMRARVEQGAIQQVGTTGEWLGGQRSGSGNLFSGKVRASNQHWNAVGFDLSTQPGGAVMIQKYEIAPLPSSISAMDHPSNSIEIMHNLVTLTVVPVGRMGGGATPDGPEIGPG